MPSGGLFAGKTWLTTPTPFPLTHSEITELEELGERLALFQSATNALYNRSVRGKLPAWIAALLDAGKPESLLAHARSPRLRDQLPRIIRPDLIVTEEGYALTELDSVPGGIGLTAWLGETFSEITGAEIVGGPGGMHEGFRSILPAGADIVISEESSAYRPEMEWLAARLNETRSGSRQTSDEPSWSIHAAETYTPRERAIYRFFELFDLENIPFAREAAGRVEAGDLELTPPMKPVLEEKLWLALFWLRPLRALWRRELRDARYQRLQSLIPYSWIMDPAPLPRHAVMPRLDSHDLRELAAVSQKDRDLVLKISGFSELAWGSRGVHIGADMPQDEWAQAVEEALASFENSPYLLQEFRKGRRVRHPYWDPEAGKIRELDGRVRLCPYYFVTAGKDSTAGNEVTLGGVLATIVPADKKILHGMSHAILAPCCVVENG